ncbi:MULTISPECIES: transketolase family protein [Streptomyces]|uniref:transketolase n=1 Tax=Streptomyces doudnae TaxID=3075536 RepID=A0ABD5ERH5_9ACTN|nr:MULTISPECIES: transketolase [unclassified Streptomyces]MDT0436460.1 transketolase [Streptomyces sp. DSM 41981]MYQ65915.1 transketolase [Streptomyces sp. SID4950]SCE10264.1 transketolase [Streptomyces sp. SolWspMP-5a-2]
MTFAATAPTPPAETDPAHGPALDAADRRAVATARALAVDAVEAAGSGHPGTALALAPVAHLLYQRHLRHDPADPGWEGRDRFVLSCGHASILQYTQLHLTGYGLELDDLRRFRRLGSLTPGHPEYRHTAGVETTTGPLGQGVATAVGMAMALKRDEGRLAGADTSPEGPANRTVWVLCSDGDLQEGLSYEAGALAGRHRLDNLVLVWDDNGIQIEGDTGLTTSEDTVARFRAQGWSTRTVALGADGDVDADALDLALRAARAETGRPSFIALRSRIAHPAPHAVGTAASHGAPLGASEAAAVKELLGVEGTFTVPDDVLRHTRRALARGARLHAAWDAELARWADAHPEAARARALAVAAPDPDAVAAALPAFGTGSGVAPRDASGKVVQALAAALPRLWGGSADLGDSNRTTIASGGSFLPADENDGRGLHGRNIHWGVREHAMAAALNGIALVGYDTPFAGTFLVFSDYQRPSLRLAALMRLPVVHVWSHDSVALGADGPTHQPVEHLASLRAMPGLAVVRPADANETAAAWLAALAGRGPVGLALARQALPVLPTPAADVRAGVARGAYVVTDAQETPDVVLLASGSEVAVALAAREQLAGRDIRARVVSVPCLEWFTEQDAQYRDFVVPPSATARVVVEAGTSFGWHGLLGAHGQAVTVDDFGTSAPPDDAMAAVGITVDAVVGAAVASLSSARS